MEHPEYVSFSACTLYEDTLFMYAFYNGLSITTSLRLLIVIWRKNMNQLRYQHGLDFVTLAGIY